MSIILQQILGYSIMIGSISFVIYNIIKSLLDLIEDIRDK